MRYTLLSFICLLKACLALTLSLTFSESLMAHAIRWERLNSISYWRSPPPRSGGGIGRGDSYCLIAPLVEPGNDTVMVWHERPTVVWQGTLEWIKVYPAGEAPPEAGLTLSERPGESLHAISLGQTLQPGQTYKLQFRANPNLAASPTYFLQAMASPEREQVAADLQALAAQGGSAEEMAIRQADYFAERQLWADFWQTVMAVQNPSSEFKAGVAQTASSICPQAVVP